MAASSSGSFALWPISTVLHLLGNQGFDGFPRLPATLPKLPGEVPEGGDLGDEDTRREQGHDGSGGRAELSDGEACGRRREGGETDAEDRDVAAREQVHQAPVRLEVDADLFEPQGNGVHGSRRQDVDLMVLGGGHRG